MTLGFNLRSTPCLVLAAMLCSLAHPAVPSEAQELTVERQAVYGGQKVAVVMQPTFYIGTFSFPGASGVFDYNLLLQAVNYPAEEPYEENRVKAAEPALAGFFATHGYFMAKVRSETKFDEAHKVANVIFHVNLNKHAKLGKIVVTGPPPQEAARLKRVLGSFFARFKGTSLKGGKPNDPERIQAAARLESAHRRDYRITRVQPLMVPMMCVLPRASSGRC